LVNYVIHYKENNESLSGNESPIKANQTKTTLTSTWWPTTVYI